MIDTQFDGIVACPHPHRVPLVRSGETWGCSDADCPDHIDRGGFLTYRETPVLIDFSADTLCRRERYTGGLDKRDVYVTRRLGRVKNWVKQLTGGSECSVTERNCSTFIEHVKKMSPNPRVLIIGSGERGGGTDALWDDTLIERTGIDIYASETTNFVADAHQLPFRGGCFDGIWIQAVLEHVADPPRVVAEIERVLTDGGLVYAETPFMQQVHEGAYDFQRFSVTGHRFLFRQFDALAMGGNKGPGVVLAWAIRYFCWGLFRSRKVATLIFYTALTFLRLFDRLMDPRAMWDGPSGVFFLGRKTAREPLLQRDLPDLYKGFQR